MPQQSILSPQQSLTLQRQEPLPQSLVKALSKIRHNPLNSLTVFPVSCNCTILSILDALSALIQRVLATVKLHQKINLKLFRKVNMVRAGRPNQHILRTHGTQHGGTEGHYLRRWPLF